ITATAIRGLRAGANAVNHASVSSVRLGGSWELSGTGAGPTSAGGGAGGGHFVVVSSSAVPVLPATATPGIWACTPVPSRTTQTIRQRTVRATLGATTRVVGAARGLAGSASVSFGSRPCRPIADATRTICSAVACTRPCPIAEEPTARSSPISEARGIALVAAPGISGAWLKPKRSAILTSRVAPSVAPSGANTELHDTANARARVPPQFSPLALSSFTPLSVVEDAYG